MEGLFLDIRLSDSGCSAQSLFLIEWKSEWVLEPAPTRFFSRNSSFKS